MSPAKPGDRVKLHTKEEIMEGVLLPRSKLLNERNNNDITVIKLDTGYNIGVDKKKITKVELIKSYPSHVLTAKKTGSKKQNNLPNVLLISCGGTISSRIDYKTGGVVAEYTADDFLTMMPELKDIANLSALNIFDKMSEDFTFEDWQTIAKAVHDNYDKYDGFIITQGTDTLHYTSAALSFFLKDLGKPVLLTAAQRSIDRGSSDAFMNLICASKAAAYLDASGVFVCMHGTTHDDYCLVHKGTKVRKMHSLRRDAFRSINDVPIAKIQFQTTGTPEDDIEIVSESFNARNDDAECKLVSSFESKVALIHWHPNMDADIIDYYLDKKYKGIVIAGSALGHVAVHGKKSFISSLKKAKDKGVFVVMVSQCLYGRVDPLVYSNLRILSIEEELIYGEDMLPETAYVKLSWILGQTKKKEEVQSLLLENIAGEINYQSHPDCFLN